MKPKSGLLTTEFWLIVATAMMNISGYVQDHTSGLAALAAAAVYALGRSIVKAKGN